jgi:hypothetical protein
MLTSVQRPLVMTLYNISQTTNPESSMDPRNTTCTPLHKPGGCLEFVNFEYNGGQTGHERECELGHDGISPSFEPVYSMDHLGDYHLEGDMSNTDAQRDEGEYENSLGMGSAHSKDKLVFPGPLIPMPPPVPASSTPKTAPAETSSLWHIDATSPSDDSVIYAGSSFLEDQGFYARRLSISSDLDADTDSEEAVRCDESGCQARFTGCFRKGNLSRHQRLKHRNANLGPVYPCEVADCGRTYSRHDALLKHLRQKHAQYTLEDLPPSRLRRGR